MGYAFVLAVDVEIMEAIVTGTRSPPVRGPSSEGPVKEHSSYKQLGTSMAQLGCGVETLRNVAVAMLLVDPEREA